MPALGMAQETGKVLRWLKREGEPVEKGEPLMEVETDKVTVELEAPASGVLGAVSAAEGEDVPVGELVALILKPGESAPERAGNGAAPAQPSNRLLQGAEGPSEAASGGASNSLLQASGEVSAPPSRRTLASPKARRLAAELGVDIASLGGSAQGGAVQAADVLAAAGSAGLPAAGEATTVGSAWRAMAAFTTQSWTSVPHFYLQREVDASRLVGWRALLKKRGQNEITFTDLLVKIVAAALRRHPDVNASWRDGEIVRHRDVNVGLAVAVEEGLVVPVVARADELTLPELAARRAALVAGARAGRLKPDEISGGTFTISNLGMYGVDAFQAIVTPPQAAILAVGRIVDRIVPVDRAPAVRPILALSLSCDHRVIDGARGARFVETLADLLEEPSALVS
jgi:pyruvate dehydrogenase E2 component (dihydrolipoamide acetyltransferase)